MTCERHQVPGGHGEMIDTPTWGCPDCGQVLLRVENKGRQMVHISRAVNGTQFFTYTLGPGEGVVLDEEFRCVGRFTP